MDSEIEDKLGMALVAGAMMVIEHMARQKCKDKFNSTANDILTRMAKHEITMEEAKEEVRQKLLAAQGK